MCARRRGSCGGRRGGAAAEHPLAPVRRRVEPRETLDYVHKEIGSLWQVGGGGGREGGGRQGGYPVAAPSHLGHAATRRPTPAAQAYCHSPAMGVQYDPDGVRKDAAAAARQQHDAAAAGRA